MRSHGVCLAGPCLAIGKHGSIVPIEDTLHERFNAIAVQS